jgi:nucleoside-diphosphate-sugar epimerase
MKILVTGSTGFIAGYLIEKLLKEGHSVIGVDNYSKYGKIEKSYGNHKNYTFVQGDAKDQQMLSTLLQDCDQFIMMAAKIGGISYFHTFAYDLIAENEAIMIASFNAAIDAFRLHHLKKITVISSSMVFENSFKYPSVEGDERKCRPPSSTYGFQKLATEYFAQGAFEQYKLPFTIIRPFNCVGTGEGRAICDHEIMSGNIRLAMSHVIPDLCQKIIKGQNPLHILGKGNQIRHYTAGEDIANGIFLSLENPAATNESFNISSSIGHTVKDVAKLIWRNVNGNKPIKYVYDDSFKYDVQKRVPSVEKAKKILGFEAKISLEDSLEAIIPWVAQQIKFGNL